MDIINENEKGDTNINIDVENPKEERTGGDYYNNFINNLKNRFTVTINEVEIILSFFSSAL